jgi:hypothetical protein
MSLRRRCTVLGLALALLPLAACAEDPPADDKGPSASPACAGQAFSITVTSKSKEVAGAGARYPTLRAAPACAAARGADLLQSRVSAIVAGHLDEWAQAWRDLATPGEPARASFEASLTVPVNTPGLVVVAAKVDSYAGGAHPSTALDSVAVDTRTGRELTRDALVAEMAAAGGPGWDFERELGRAATAALRERDVGAPAVELHTTDVQVYPTRRGLAVTADGLGAAVGALQFTIAWDRLVGAQDHMSFIPADWG